MQQGGGRGGGHHEGVDTGGKDGKDEELKHFYGFILWVFKTTHQQCTRALHPETETLMFYL